jgi:CRP/FNR family transcriptional regulator, anaerobic regulatory protein
MTAKQKIDEAFGLALEERHCRRCPVFLLNVCRVGVETFAAKNAAALPSVEQTGWSVASRSLICRHQESREFVPVFCSGWAGWYVDIPGGGRQIISFILPGELVSAAVVFEPIEYCRVEAITDCQYRTFRRAELIQILFSRPANIEEIMRAWLDEKIRSDQLIVDLGRRTAEERIAHLIMQLAERIESRGMIKSFNERIPFPLRHHHIADATGLTPVHVSKVLSELRKRDILVIRNRFLSILDPVALFRLAGRWRQLDAR